MHYANDVKKGRILFENELYIDAFIDKDRHEVEEGEGGGGRDRF